MGNHQDRAGILLQIILEPEQRLEIKMVGRLVEHQQVGLLHEQAREVGAHDPAAAHFTGRTVKILFAKGQAGQDFFGRDSSWWPPSSSKRAWMP